MIYRVADGAAVSESGDAPDAGALAAQGLAAALQTHRPDPLVETWDPVLKTSIARVAPTSPWVSPPVGSSYRFTGYHVLDNPVGVQFDFYGPLPGGPGTISVVALDSEIVAAASQPAVVALVTAKLTRKLRASIVAAKLDALIGQSVVV